MNKREKRNLTKCKMRLLLRGFSLWTHVVQTGSCWCHCSKQQVKTSSTQTGCLCEQTFSPPLSVHPHFPQLWQAFTCASCEQNSHCAVCCKQCLLFCLKGSKTHVSSLCPFCSPGFLPWTWMPGQQGGLRRLMTWSLERAAPEHGPMCTCTLNFFSSLERLDEELRNRSK